LWAAQEKNAPPNNPLELRGPHLLAPPSGNRPAQLSSPLESIEKGLKIVRMQRLAPLLIAALSLAGCSVLGKEISFHPESGIKEWVKKDSTIILNFDHSSIEAYPMWGSHHAISLGPPLLPFIPSFGAKAHWDNQFLRLKLRTSAEVLKIDLSEVKLNFSSGISVSGEKFEEQSESGRVHPMNDRILTLENQEEEIYISFNAPFDQSESFKVEFGNVVIGTLQIPLPSLKYNRETKYRYFPFIFSN
jgi:hypothetical protein